MQSPLASSRPKTSGLNTHFVLDLLTLALESLPAGQCLQYSYTSSLSLWSLFSQVAHATWTSSLAISETLFVPFFNPGTRMTPSADKMDFFALFVMDFLRCFLWHSAEDDDGDNREFVTSRSISTYFTTALNSTNGGNSRRLFVVPSSYKTGRLMTFALLLFTFSNISAMECVVFCVSVIIIAATLFLVFDNNISLCFFSIAAFTHSLRFSSTTSRPYTRSSSSS